MFEESLHDALRKLIYFIPDRLYSRGKSLKKSRTPFLKNQKKKVKNQQQDQKIKKNQKKSRTDLFE